MKEERSQFQRRVREVMMQIGMSQFDYDENEFWLVQAPYETIEFYAVEKRLMNTAIALPLARGLHNGVYRKSSIRKGSVTYKLPYVIHPLVVCRVLIDLHIPLSNEEEDILLAAALCHDMIEDLPFEDHGRELYTKYRLDPRVYEVVKKVSKRKDFTEEETAEHFRKIGEDKLAALVKLSDRGNNVEDLYNMSVRKVHEYVGETRKYFFDVAANAEANFPELYATYEMLMDKIVTLTEAAEILVDRYDGLEKELLQEAENLRLENERLRKEWKRLWDI